MLNHHRYIANENIERFETLLRGGRLDRQQTETVISLLAQARADLASLDRQDCPNGFHAADDPPASFARAASG
jgi:hypothetical protein